MLAGLSLYAPRCALAWDGSPNLEPGLVGNDILLFEDFESPDYSRRWPVHWDEAAGAGTVTSPTQYVFSGSRSAYLEVEKGDHRSEGSGEYVPDKPIDDVAYARLYLRLPDEFSMGTANQLKLFGIRGGATLKNTYGGAGKKAGGSDKFSAKLSLNNWQELHFYTYHLDQRERWGDWQYCSNLFCRAKLSPGKWFCLEMMLKTNTPGKRDGRLEAWLDGRSIIKVGKIRFRDVDEVKIRRFSMENYFGGGGDRNTSPQDQRLYIDNFVVSRSRIGCMGSE